MKRNNHKFCNQRVTVSYDELVDICKKSFSRTQIASWDIGTSYAVMEQFELLLQMEKSKYSWFHKHSNKIFTMAGISLLLLTVKCLAEAYAGGK